MQQQIELKFLYFIIIHMFRVGSLVFHSFCGIANIAATAKLLKLPEVLVLRKMQILLV